MSRQLKVSSFYGDNLPRPVAVLGPDGEPVADRVDAPRINDALLQWAARVPVKLGGALVKPVWSGPEPAGLKEARTDFQIFFQERYEDVLADNPSLLAADRRAMLSAASIYWREKLSSEERAAYHSRSVEEKAAAVASIAEAEEADPKFKTFREKMQKYKESVAGILSAAKVSAGPLWRAQRRLNAKYRALEGQRGAEEEHEEAADEAAEGAADAGKKAAGKKGPAKEAPAKKAPAKKGGKGAGKRLVDSDSESSDESEGEWERAAAAADAAVAMEKLMLATAGKAKKGGKAPGSSGKKSARGRTAAKAGKAQPEPESEEEEVTSGSEGEAAAGSPDVAQQVGRRPRSGAAALAQRLSSRGRKGYTDVFELPPSQSSTPAAKVAAKGGKAGRGSGKAAAGKAPAAAVPAKSPGKRTRGARAATVAEEPAAEASPAKKARRSARK